MFNQKRALITGIKGFVGPFLQAELEKNGFRVFGLDLIEDSAENYFKVDILQLNQVERAIKKIKPEYIFHLAGFSSPKKSFDQPKKCYQINVLGTENLLQAGKKYCPQVKILMVSSGQVYQISNNNQPLKETDPLDSKSSPYVASRIEQEKLIKKFPGLKIIISRSFNHIGPGQREGVIAEFSQQLVACQNLDQILVGNLKVARDFTDVRDVVRAYRSLLELARPGEIYNICSGQASKIEQILNILIKLSGKTIKATIDPKRFRPIDSPLLLGDNTKLRQEINWQPKIPLLKSLQDIYQYWQQMYEAKS